MGYGYIYLNNYNTGDGFCVRNEICTSKTESEGVWSWCNPCKFLEFWLQFVLFFGVFVCNYTFTFGICAAAINKECFAADIVLSDILLFSLLYQSWSDVWVQFYYYFTNVLLFFQKYLHVSFIFVLFILMIIVSNYIFVKNCSF